MTEIDEYTYLRDARMLYEASYNLRENIFFQRRATGSGSFVVLSLIVGGLKIPQRAENYIEHLVELMVKIGMIDPPADSKDEYLWVHLFDSSVNKKLNRLESLYWKRTA